MKHYVLTSDKYNFLLEGYAELFNKHWDSDIQVVLLGFDTPSITLPNNFTFESLGQQSDWNTWSGPLIEYFSNVEDDYFFLCFEDHYIVDDVELDLMDEALTYCDGDIDKVYLMIDGNTITSEYKGNFHNSRDAKGANVNNSLLPAIWKREFFLRLLDPKIKTAHEFEGVNNKTLGGKIIQSTSIIYPNVDAARKGGYNTSMFKQFTNNKTYNCGAYVQPVNEDDINVFYKMYEKWKERYGV